MAAISEERRLSKLKANKAPEYIELGKLRSGHGSLRYDGLAGHLFTILFITTLCLSFKVRLLILRGLGGHQAQNEKLKTEEQWLLME